MPPEMPVSVPPAVSSPATMSARNSRLLFILGLVVLAAVFVVGVFVFLNPGAVSVPWFGQKQEPLPGTLIMRVAQPWVTPSGNTASGIVSYTPSTGGVAVLLNPATARGTLPLSVSSNGGSLLAMRVTASSSELVSVDTTTQTEHIVAASSAGTVMLSPTLSADGAHVAYLSVPPLGDLIHSSNAAKYFVTEGATSTLRAGVTLPAAYQPHLMLVSLKATNAMSLDQGTPFTFSSNGQYMLTATTGGFGVVSVANGSRVPLTGDLPKTKPLSIVGSPHDPFILGIDNTGIVVYDINWTNGDTTRVGDIAGATQAAFNTNGELLAVTGSTASVYSVTPDALHLIKTYALLLPQAAHVITWISP